MSDTDANKFDEQTAGVPPVIGADPIEGQVIPPGQPEAPGSTAPAPGTGIPEFALELTFDVLFSAIAKTRGDHWKLEGDDSKKLAQAWKPYLDEKINEWMGTNQNPALMAGVMVSAFVLAPRIKAEYEVMAKPKPETSQATVTRETDPAPAATPAEPIVTDAPEYAEIFRPAS